MFTVAEAIIIGRVSAVDPALGEVAIETFSDGIASHHCVALPARQIADLDIEVGVIAKVMGALAVVDGRAKVLVSPSHGSIALLDRPAPAASVAAGLPEASGSVQTQALASSQPSTTGGLKPPPFAAFGAKQPPASKPSASPVAVASSEPVATKSTAERKPIAPSFTRSPTAAPSAAGGSKPAPISGPGAEGRSPFGKLSQQGRLDRSSVEVATDNGRGQARRDLPSGPDDLDSHIPF